MSNIGLIGFINRPWEIKNKDKKLFDVIISTENINSIETEINQKALIS